MDLFSIALAVGLSTGVGFLFYERSRQLAPPRKKAKYYMNGREIEEQFKEIEAGLYADTKSDDEFFLGLALISLLDSLDNPDQYDNNALDFVHTNADELAAYFRLKYDKEIKALNENNDNISDGV